MASIGSAGSSNQAIKGSAVGALALCALLWSTAGFLIKLVDWDPFAIAGGRSLVAVFVMLAFVRRPSFRFTANQVLAAVFYSLTMILFVTANKMTTAANAILLQYTEPVYIILLGPLLLKDEGTDWLDWISVAGVLAGMALFFVGELDLSANLGNLLALASGVSFALFAIFMRRQREGRTAESFMLAHAITFLLSVPFMFRFGLPSGLSLGGVALLGIFQIGLPSILYARGILGVSAIGAALITMIEPVMNPLWVFLLVGEKPTLQALAGGLIIVATVTGRTVLKVRKMRYHGPKQTEE